jgi:hypothetical protein
MIGIGLGVAQLRKAGASVAPDYVEPVDDDPIAPPAGEPEPPTTTPIDPVTEEPEPGFDPAFTLSNRIDITDSGQSAVRTTNDPNTYGIAYVASPISGNEYWEYDIRPGTPRNATFAIGIATLAMPLNGIPGERATEIAWWSDGTVRQNGATLVSLGSAGQLGRGDLAGMAINAAGQVFLFKNCTALNAGAAVGSLASGTRHPFVALYSARTQITMQFSTARFDCALPDGFFPIGQVPLPWTPNLATGTMAAWWDAADSLSVTGTTINSWADKSGNSRTLTPTNMVTSTTRFGGLPVPRMQNGAFFDAPILIANMRTIFFVWAQDAAITSASAALRLMRVSDGTNFIVGTGSFTSFLTNEVVGYRAGSAQNRGISSAVLPSGLNGSGDIFAMRVGETDTSIDLHITGSADLKDIGAGGNYPLWSGSGVTRIGEVATAALGHLAEVVIFESRLSNTDFDRVNGYLAHKWGLEAKLPSGHPFKSAPPLAS